MMTQLRRNTAIVMWVVIFAFIGMMVIQWGANFSGKKRLGSADAVGIVNGEEIAIKYFRQILTNAARQREKGERQDDGALVREVWDALVRDMLLRQEIDRLGIEISDEELASSLFRSPPAGVEQIPAFQTDGEFDPGLYSQFLSDQRTYDQPRNKAFISQMERTRRGQLMNQRLQRLLLESIRITPSQVRQEFLDAQEKVLVEYVFVAVNAIGDDEVELSEEELQANYQEQLHDFEHPEQIRMGCVLFPRVPSQADSLEVAEEIGRIRTEIMAGADFAEMATAVSEDQGSAESGGDLGTFGAGRMVKPFEEAAFALATGEVSDPVETQFGWHLIKVEEKLKEEGEEQIRARHILLKHRPSPETADTLAMQVEQFVALARERGLEAAAQAEQLEVRDTGYLQGGGPVPGLGQGTTWVINELLNSEVGTVVRGGVEQALWVAELTERRDAGAAPLDEVRPRVERSLLNDKKREKAGQKLEAVRREVAAGKDLAAAAAAAELEVQKTESFALSDYVPAIGRRNAFISTALRTEVGQVSEVVVQSRGAYLLRVLERTPADMSRLDEERAEIEQEIAGRRQEEALRSWFAQLNETAEIVDNRHLFGYRF